MFNIKPFDTPPKITYSDISTSNNEIIINVSSGSNNKEITVAVVSTAVANAIQEVNSCKN